MLFSEKTVALVPIIPNNDKIKGPYFDKIGPKVLLSWHIESLRTIGEIDEICLCTTEGRHAEKLRKFAEEEQISFYCHDGKKKDLITVVSHASGVTGAEICVQTKAESPLIEQRKLWKHILFLKSNPHAGATEGCSDAHVSRRRLWEMASKLRAVKTWAKKPFPITRLAEKKPKEYVGVWMSEEGVIKEGSFLVEDRASLRLIRKLYCLVSDEGKKFTYHNALGALQKYPQLERNLAVDKEPSEKRKAFTEKIRYQYVKLK